MSKIVMTRLDGSDRVEILMDGDLTWMEVTDRFVQFIQGCGYQVTARDVGEYLNPADDQLSEVYTDEMWNWNTVTVSSPGPDIAKPAEYSFEPLTSAMKNWNPNI